MRKPEDNEAWLAHRRELKRLKRLQTLLERASSPGSSARRLTSSDKNRKRLLRLFVRGSAPRLGPRVQLAVPPVFCLIANPQESIAFLHTVANTVASDRAVHFVLDHSKVREIGLSAEVALSCLVDCYNRRRSLPKTKKRRELVGYMPVDTHCEKLIRAVGTPQMLGLIPRDSDVENGRVRVMYRRSFRDPTRRDPFSKDDKARAVEELLDYLNKCLEDHRWSLNPEALQLLTQYIGEIVENAEQHAGGIDWTVAGYLHNADDRVHVCQLAIFNFGHTIADSFARLEEDSFASRDVLEYRQAHRRQGLFGANWTEEALTTVVALQERISSRQQPGTSRGNGTIEIISFFEAVSKSMTKDGKSSAMMTLISGSTLIQFDGTYALGKDEKGRTIIALNAENDLHRKPDPSAVRVLDSYFPGTVFSIQFPIPLSMVDKEEGGET